MHPILNQGNLRYVRAHWALIDEGSHEMRFRVGVGSACGLAMVLTLSSCQENGWKIGVLNLCTSPIDAWTFEGANPAAEHYSVDWKSVEPNEAKSIWSGTERESRGYEYLWVRSAGSTDTPEPVRVDPASAVRDFGDRHVYTVVSGELCPKP